MDDAALSDSRTDEERVSEFWGQDRKLARPASWLEHPIALEYLHRRVSGSGTEGTYAYWRRRFLQPPAGLALSLGCGLGAFERAMIGIGAVERFEAHDLSAGAIETARKDAAAAGLADRIAYSVMDLNAVDLPENRYDAIFAISSAHHVLMLEPYFKACRRALKPGGLMFLDEYVGPSRFQCSPFAVRAINRIRDILPEKYRLNVFDGNRPAGEYVNSSIETFELNDPSEAVRSAEIMSVLKLYFDVVDYKPYGGAILHMLLSGLAGNFDEGKEEDVAILRLLALMEELLEEAGAIGTDFAAIVAKPKG